MCASETESTPGSDRPGGGAERASALRSTREETIARVRGLIDTSPELASLLLEFEPGDLLLREGGFVGKIFCIFDGTVTLFRRGADSERIAVDFVREGELVGLLSYFTGARNFFDAEVTQRGTGLVLSFEKFRSLEGSAPELYRGLQSLIYHNLIERYRRMARLHMELATVNSTLEKERDALRRTVAELEQTRSRLVEQEKMAMLGRLVAGLAHEINNPASAILRSIDYLREAFEEVLGQRDGKQREIARRFWEEGVRAQMPDTSTQRERLESLVRKHPKISRPLLRRLAVVSPEVLGMASDLDDRKIRQLLPVFEAGLSLQTVQVSSERIRNLVVNLKKYARPGAHGVSRIDLREGIRETLLILRGILKRYEVEVDLPEIPPVDADPGRLNQVWTNLIHNACEAMGESGRLRVSCGRSDENRVFVRVQDSGPGVPDELKGRIFDASFTTKEQAKHFGLGLGLSISRDIIADHAGVMTVEDAPGGGAVFCVEVPSAVEDATEGK